MIYIKRFLYLLFMATMTIIGMVIFLITIITFPFVSMVDYIVHGKLTKDYVIKVIEWLYDVLDKFKPE
mgnify:CR=1 FL=1